MEPTSILPAIGALAIALATCFLIAKLSRSEFIEGRYVSIDGLRGLLAFFVFLHHSCIWYFYINTGQWTTPPSYFYTQLGQSSVIIFFMITGFLFFSKLIDARSRDIDWQRLFVSRVLRLTPLYIFAVFIVLSIVLYLGKGSINQTVSATSFDLAQWLSFTIFGAPNINNTDTGNIMAYVYWTLPYEWSFYLALPLFALFVGVVSPSFYLFLPIVGLAMLSIRFNGLIVLPFLGGIVASILNRSDLFSRLLKKGLAARPGS